jgi:hypothetical protein
VGAEGGAAYAADPYALQRQYQYYEHLRLTDPAAYMRVYKQLLAGQQPDYRHYASYADGNIRLLLYTPRFLKTSRKLRNILKHLYKLNLT